MRFERECWRTSALQAGLLAAGLSMVALGCHGKGAAGRPAAGQIGEAISSTVLAEDASTMIAEVCKRQSYATASVGLIAGETGLREDVFELRNPVSYKVIPYRLRATVKLEGMLRQGAEATGRLAAQASCMRQFADHLKKLTDPLVEEARSEKEIDRSAFNNAEKEAQQELKLDDPQIKPQH
ncbi:MAG TPA: hypothetical protein VFE22_03520 [Edaphobacter sp.]|nr:hypothetical protein [Edaphobacter sp.]